MSILVIAEHDNKNLKPATLNTVAAANEISGSVHILVAGNSCKSVADEAAALDSVEKVILADDSAYENQLAESTANLIKSISADYSHILSPATTFGKNVMPRLSALLDVQQISEITEVVSDDTFKRPIYAGSCIATVKSNDSMKVITVRATAFDPINPSGGSASIESISAEGASDLSSFVNEEIAQSDRPELTAASIVISGGRGMQSGDNFHLLETIAAKNGILGALREELIDTSKESQKFIESLQFRPGGVFGSCRYKLKDINENLLEYERLIEVFEAHKLNIFFY